MIPLYKGKGAGKGEVCGNYRGITLLSSAGKILAGILLSRLNTEIVKTIRNAGSVRIEVQLT